VETLAVAIGRTGCIFALMFLPAAVLGIAGSGFLYKKIQARHFRPLTFMLVIIAGILAIIAGIRELIW
jgi:predicted membrane channel-forming protein YqfA (hemolysin III family)